MFRLSARDTHTWQDFAKNVGKLSLAGLFLGGTWFLSNAYAMAPAPILAASLSQTPVQQSVSLLE